MTEPQPPVIRRPGLGASVRLRLAAAMVALAAGAVAVVLAILLVRSALG